MSTREVIGALPLTYSSFHPQSSLSAGKRCEKGENTGEKTLYGSLLLITPAFSGLIRGRLPVEISTRGAKFADGNERSAELDEAAIGRLEETIADLAQTLTDTQVETERLKKVVGSDSRQQEVISDR